LSTTNHPIRKTIIIDRTGGEIEVHTAEFTEVKSDADIASDLPFIFGKLYIYMDHDGSLLRPLVQSFPQLDAERKSVFFHLIDTQMHGIPQDRDETCWVIEFDGIKTFEASWTTEPAFDAFIASEIVGKLDKVDA
jgi:hypothetical protein